MKAIVSFLHTSEIARLIFSLVAYGSLFAVSIRQNRRNRAVVLGIVTVGICVAFLLLATSKYVPPWLVGTTAALTVLAGLGILVFIAIDVMRWASVARASPGHGKNRDAGSDAGGK
jgi:protein-S-isoprenylcysteine O-methyltransferase Ste14